jgi:hypothetical protein
MLSDGQPAQAVKEADQAIEGADSPLSTHLLIRSLERSAAQDTDGALCDIRRALGTASADHALGQDMVRILFAASCKPISSADAHSKPRRISKPWQRSNPAGTTRLLTAAASPSFLKTAADPACSQPTLSPQSSDLPFPRWRPALEYAFKIPHHGSQANVLPQLFDLVRARHYLISTSGARFGHPHDEAMARIITLGGSGQTIWFNYATAHTARWADKSLLSRYLYDIRYPVDPIGGITIAL